MDLKGKQTIGPTGFLVVIGQLGHFHPVDVMYEMKTLGSDSVTVPFLFLDRLAELLGVSEFLGILL